jgi:hypothetical protein
MQQYRSRKFKISSDYSSNALVDYVRREQEYLGCTDEMDAYSFNIACELIDYFGNDREQISKFLNDKILSKKKISPSWSKYFRAFEKNHNHPIIKRMKNKILKYIPRATSGKPYIRNQWINH